MVVDLLVLNYNDADTVIEFIRRIKTFSSLRYIVIIDNNSTDDSYEKLKKLKNDKIHLVKSGDNGGYASGNNYGIKYARNVLKSRYVIISNPDVIFENHIINNMYENIIKYDAASITCKMRCLSGIHNPIAWRLPDYHTCLFETLILFKKVFHYTSEYPLEYLSKPVVEVEAIPGSFFMADLDKMNNVGYFDENTFLYYEENILGYRLREKNYKQLLITTDEYIHNHSVSINKTISSVSKRLKLQQESRVYYCKKYLKTNCVQNLLLAVFFEIGKINYLTVKRLLNFKIASHGENNHEKQNKDQ